MLRTADESRTGAVWKLGGAARQLDANLVRLRPGTVVAEHVEPDLDVLLVVLEGDGSLRHAGEEEQLTPGALVFIARGERRSVAAGAEGLAYLTAHRRRPGLTIARPPAREGGEPACLLSRICPACDRVSEDAAAAYCARCGGRLPTS
ncbi:cupin domain-containing protein [Streptomyces sp. AcE210]|uniref:cupin domain-containing protein n=1 Tax=Streptomyces sp. AcE210 TaxID=2292703 RepID=UPI001F0C7622|nr:cupin domain-containing protein [Streptomyces sp. AcE210]